MKSFKELTDKINTLTEGEETTWGSGQRSAHSDYGVHRIEDSEQLARINAFLNAFTQKEFLDPKGAMAQLRHKFNTMGLDFEWNNASSFNGDSVELPLNRWGGSFGTIPTHDLKQGFYTSDNIKEISGGAGLSLKITIDQHNGGLYNMDAAIIPVMEDIDYEDEDTLVEDHDARELHLYADNHADLHRQRVHPIQKNLRNKMATGKYDSDKAHKAWNYAAKDASDRYHKEHGHRFDKATVHKVASKMRDNFEGEAKDGDHDHHLHKKYKGHKVT